MRIDAGNTGGKWEFQDVRALAYDFSGIVGRTISADDRRVIALTRTLLNRGSMEWSVIGGNGLDFIHIESDSIHSHGDGAAGFDE